MTVGTRAGGYEDDRDEGDWLLYTGAGGRDLSGNKRTNKVQSSDQEFEGANKALLKSCSDGLPVRVLRSYKEKRSCYAPVKTDPSQSIRYDGIYKIIAAWRTAGQQGMPSVNLSSAGSFFLD
jgi:E3 ubiquitin-protein ligase UHRF1